MKRILIGCLAFALLLVACDSKTGPNGNGGGTFDPDHLTGFIYAADGTTPIPGAQVSLTFDGLLSADFETTTDAEGKFIFEDELPEGRALLEASKGGFYASSEVTVPDDFSRDIELELEISGFRIGVVPGSFDSIEEILSSLGYGYTTIYDHELIDWATFAELEMLFINCGSDDYWANDSSVIENIERFVAEGGFLYASDWAWEYINNVWPGAINFLDEQGYGPWQGEEGVVTGHVMRQELRDYLGSGTVDIHFDLGGWVIIETAGSGTEVLIQGKVDYYGGTINNSPLMVDFNHGAGKVGYTTFHNEPQLDDAVRTVLVYFIFNQPM